MDVIISYQVQTRLKTLLLLQDFENIDHLYD